MFKRIVDNLENSDLPIYYFVFTFFFAVTLRNFLDLISDRSEIDLLMHLHNYSFFVAITLSMMLLVYFFTKEKIIKIFKVFSVAILAVNITPVIDLLVSKGAGLDTSYYFSNDIVRGFFTIGGFNEGVTYGLKTEIILIILGWFFYFRLKKLSLIKSLMGSFFSYCIIFFYGVLPTFLKFILNSAGINFINSQYSMFSVYLFFIIILLLILSFIVNSKISFIIFKNLRFSRILYYWLIFFFGFLLAWQVMRGFGLNSETVFYLPFILISILSAGVFSAITNDISDMEIDKISNPNRPLVKAEIDSNVYKKISWIMLVISLACAMAVNYKAFFLILFCIGTYFLYSMPPLRIKRLFFLSKLVILLNSLALIILGFVVFNNDFNILTFLNTVINIGSNINHFFAIATVSAIIFLLASSFIDIKDYEGDKQAGIKTLPTVLGLRTSQFLIGLAFLLLYAIVGFLLKNWLMFSSLIIIGCIEFWIINRKKYQEKYVFAVYLASLLVIMYMVFK